jgi:hypothetical protein
MKPHSNTTAIVPTAQPQGTEESLAVPVTDAIEKPLETSAQVLAEQAKAAVQARYIMAMKNPRDWDVVRQRLLKECERPSFAVVARYSKPVGAGTVSGPSIRFVEAALKVMGNVMPEQVVLYDDRQKRIIRVTVTDLESNLTYSKEILIDKTVERKHLKPGQTPLGSRINSRGERVYLVEATEDEMLNKEAALTSKALRQLGLRIVPGDLIDECMETVLATVRRKATQDPDAEKKAIIDAFADLGVRVTDLKEYLGVDSLETLTPKDLANLRAVYQALRDGETNWREIMEQREAVRGMVREEGASSGSSRASAVLEALKEARGTPVAAHQGGSGGPEQPQIPYDSSANMLNEAQTERGKKANRG